MMDTGSTYKTSMLVGLVSATAFFGDHFFVLQVCVIENIFNVNQFRHDSSTWQGSIKNEKNKKVWKQILIWLPSGSSSVLRIIKWYVKTLRGKSLQPRNPKIFSMFFFFVFLLFFFSIRVFFHGHWQLTWQQGKGGGHLIPLYHFHPLTNIQPFMF